MPRRVLPALTRLIRWLILPAVLLILWAVWLYFREGAYWSAGLQLLMLALLPLAYRWLSHLPAQVSFDQNWLYVSTAEAEQQVPLRAIERLSCTFAWLNGRSVYQLHYSTGEHRPPLYVLSGPALQALDAYWREQRPT